jgi:hypothetical protein
LIGVEGKGRGEEKMIREMGRIGGEREGIGKK